MPRILIKGVEHAHLPVAPRISDYATTFLREELMRVLNDDSLEVRDEYVDGQEHPNNVGFPIEMDIYLGSSTVALFEDDSKRHEGAVGYPLLDDLGSQTLDGYFRQISDIIEQSS